MDENLIDKPNQSIAINSDRLKYIAGILKKTIEDLKIAKERADDAWNNCNSSLGEEITRDINERKKMVNKRYEDAINKLEKEAEALDSVANIWNETEVEIKASSKAIETMFTKLNETISSIWK